MDHAFGTVPKMSSPNPESSRLSLMLSSRSFIALYFTFKSMMHFQLIFMKGVISASKFIILLVAVQLFQHHLFKRLLFPH